MSVSADIDFAKDDLTIFTSLEHNNQKHPAMNLAELLKDSAYKLTQFNLSQIAALEAGIWRVRGL